MVDGSSRRGIETVAASRTLRSVPHRTPHVLLVPLENGHSSWSGRDFYQYAILQKGFESFYLGPTVMIYPDFQ
jgi:hypothetical protein